MANNLHNALRAISLEDDDPILLPDDPKFRTLYANSNSLLGRLLYPDSQAMSRIFNYMPPVWSVYDCIRGIALSQNRFQFIIQREVDMLRVLKDLPWSYNHWTLLLERWIPNPTPDFFSTLKIWIRIRNIAVNFYIVDTMYTLTKKIGKVEVIAYDPKVSHTTNYIRAKVTFHVDNPAIEAKNLLLSSGETVVIHYEYEKIHKNVSTVCASLMRNQDALSLQRHN